MQGGGGTRIPASLLDLVPPPSPIVPLAQRGAFTPSLGGSSSRALLGPPIEVVILDVHPLPSGPSSPLFDVTNGWVYPGLLRFVSTPRGRHQLVSIQSIKPPHHSCMRATHTRCVTLVGRPPHFFLTGKQPSPSYWGLHPPSCYVTVGTFT